MQINTEYIVAQLQRRAGERQLGKVAKGSGVNLRTLQRMVKENGGSTKKLEKVQKFLAETEKQKKLEVTEEA